MKPLPTFDIEIEVQGAYTLSPYVNHTNTLIVAGCDEAGRGPLCGPVVAAAVIFPTFDIDIPVRITDSKQMTHAARAAALEWIKANTVWATGQCSPAEIDELNILHASMLAMKRAVDNLATRADFILFDGNRIPAGFTAAPMRSGDISSCAQFDYVSLMDGNDRLARAIVKGDSKSLSIAAASIIAKESRDQIMADLALQFPQYGWDKNAGYPTASHLQAIKKYGINEHYRKSYGPCKGL